VEKLLRRGLFGSDEIGGLTTGPPAGLRAIVPTSFVGNTIVTSLITFSTNSQDGLFRGIELNPLDAHQCPPAFHWELCTSPPFLAYHAGTCVKYRALSMWLMRKVATYIWAAPNSLLGVLFVPLALLRGGRVRVVQGALEVHGGWCEIFLRRCTLLKGGASAMTLGHVILGRDQLCLDHCRVHEHVHIRQAERWRPLFIPAYLSASLWAWLSGRNPYRDNYFEREAYASGN
jgi:hypothetical protein